MVILCERKFIYRKYPKSCYVLLKEYEILVVLLSLIFIYFICLQSMWNNKYMEPVIKYGQEHVHDRHLRKVKS